jgi:predicted nucleic-acid-binding protein
MPEIIARAMLLYIDGNIDFIDAYNGLWLQEQGISSAVTFDKKHFKRISGLSVYTPDEFNKTWMFEFGYSRAFIWE